MSIFSLNEVKIEQVRNVSEGNFKYWSESGLYGYYGGGYVPPALISTIDRLDFSTETVTTPSPKLSAAKARLSALSNSN